MAFLCPLLLWGEEVGKGLSSAILLSSPSFTLDTAATPPPSLPLPLPHDSYPRAESWHARLPQPCVLPLGCSL